MIPESNTDITTLIINSPDYLISLHSCFDYRFTMNKLPGYLLLFAIGVFASCEDKMENRSETFCVEAQYVRNYHCSSSEPLHVVELLSPNALATRFSENGTGIERYQAAMLDLPDSLHIVGKKFYMRFYRDAAREKKAMIGYCTLEYLPVNVLVCQGISQSCP